MKDETPEGEQGGAGQGRAHTGRGTSEGGGATFWQIQVLPRSALGIPSRQFVGVAAGAAVAPELQVAQEEAGLHHRYRS